MNFPRSIVRYLKTIVSKKKISLGQLETTDEVAAELMHPDFAPIESHYGCKVSADLKRHAIDRDLVFT